MGAGGASLILLTEISGRRFAGALFICSVVLLDVDHLHGHAPVQNEVLPGHEAGILGDELAGLGDVLWHPYPARRTLFPVGLGVIRLARP